MKYQQLTEGKRYQIFALLKQEMSIKRIASSLSCHRSTVYRELKRHQGKQEYCPDKAQAMCLAKRKQARKYRIPDTSIVFMRRLIENDWSPEQVSQLLTAVGLPMSHEWIYQYIHNDKRKKGTLYRHLRQGHKRYRRGKRTKANPIKHAVSIDDRPTIVDSRQRFGDWEVDTVLGKHRSGALVTLLERKSRFYLVKKVASKSAKEVTQGVIELLKPYKAHVHTITADNGREFAHHHEIAEQLETKVYFAHPYSAWERGANENANGLLRQYIPKGKDLRQVSEKDIDMAMERINYRPKKCLGFKQPAMVFNQLLAA